MIQCIKSPLTMPTSWVMYNTFRMCLPKPIWTHNYVDRFSVVTQLWQFAAVIRKYFIAL